jgi:chromosome segregation ATPase
MDNRCEMCKNFKENKILKEKIGKLENEKEELNEQIKALEEAIEYKDQCRTSHREQVYKLVKEISDLNAIIKWNNDAYASLLDENKELKDKIKMFEESDKHKDSTFTDLLGQHDFLVDQNAKLKEENSKLLDALVEKEKFVKELEEKNKALEETVEYKDYCRSLRWDQVHKLEAEVKDLKNKLKKAEGKGFILDSLYNLYKELDARIEEANNVRL